MTHARPSLPAITLKDLVDLDLAPELDVDFVAQSFVRSAADVHELRALLAERGARAHLIVKVERVDAMERIDEILEVCDGVMVARGDYGVEAGVEQVPVMQKQLITRAASAGKCIITATQMLESMLVNSEPTRAEASDVANAILDGTSAVMLSGETSVGPHPVEAVRWMAKIAIAAEQDLKPSSNRFELAEDPGAAVMSAAVQLATHRDAAALIVPTSTGGSARACAKYRPGVPIVALAHDPGTAQQLALEWGVIPSTIPKPETVDDLIAAAIEHGAEVAALEPGSLVVLTAGNVGEKGTTNLIVLRDVPASVARGVTTPGVVTGASGAAALTSVPLR